MPASIASLSSGERMNDNRRQQRAYTVLAAVLLLLVVPLIWTRSTQAALLAGAAGVFLLSIASTLVKGEFEEAWEASEHQDDLRPSDPSGWTEGRSESDLGMGQRRDDSSQDGTWDGLEGPLEPGEVLRAEADALQAEAAAIRWAEQEATDPELIEAGVERLGDLVATGHFARTAEPGGFRRLDEGHEPKTT